VSEFDRHSIVRGLDLDLPALPSHVFPQVSQDQATAVKIVPVFAQLIKAQVKIEARVMERALANKEITCRNLRRKIFEPSGVSGVCDLLPTQSDPVALRIRFGLVLSGESIDRGGSRVESLSGVNLTVVDRKGPRAVVEVVSHGAGQSVHPGLDFWRADDLDRVLSRVGVKRRVQKCGDPTEVVAVKMRDEDRVDFISGQAELDESGVGGATAIQEHSAALAANENSGLPASPCAKRVTGSYEDDFTH
jgi:hypothetical protein